MNNTRSVLTAEDLQGIYTDPKLRNEIAYAHGFCDRDGVQLGLQTCSYPHTFEVTEEQIAEAQREIDRDRAELVKKYTANNTLVFIGMGMSYEPKYEGDVCNHRIRTVFQNIDGQKCFVEFGTGKDYETTRCDHSILNYGQENEVNHYGRLERRDSMPKFTLENIMNLVNRTFNCKFTEIVVDQFTLTCEDITCVSPK